MDLLLVLLRMAAGLAVWSVLIFISTFFHELGHAIMYRLFSGGKDWKIILGSGRTIFAGKRLIINVWFILGGWVTWPDISAPKFHRILWYSGGFLFNIALAVLFFMLLQISGSDIWQFALYFNIIQAAMTMTPMTYTFEPYSGMESDGLRIYRLIKDKEN